MNGAQNPASGGTCILNVHVFQGSDMVYRNLLLTVLSALALAPAPAAADPPRPLPLPLAGHWSAAARPSGFDTRFQVDQLRRGRHLLPWFPLPRPDRPQDQAPLAYYEALLSEAALQHRPISFVSTQWDSLVMDAVCRAQAPDASRTRETSECGTTGKALSPFSPIGLWYQAGLAWGSEHVLQHLQHLYPDPPFIEFLSNNEQPKLTWRQLRSYSDASDEQWRREIGDAWILRYRELQRGFRDGLGNAKWQRAARFVGYDAIGPGALGRWPGWQEYSLYASGRLDPWPHALDGSSVSYYVNDWDAGTDYQVWSPQLEAMNWIPMIAEAKRDNPGFMLEMSTWDGQQPGAATDKAESYRRLGQSYDRSRYGGMVQFGMWLLRPQVVREFRDHLATRARFGEYFEAVMDDVDRVHRTPDLRRFWRAGRLLVNPGAAHPYDQALPPGFPAQRWFLLDSRDNPDRPWSADTPLAVFALALELGDAPSRQWLVYAFSPLGQLDTTVVSIPGGPREAPVRTSREGAFTLLKETSDRLSTRTLQ